MLGKGTTALMLPTCINAQKDGTETDLDCGGFCKAKCGRSSRTPLLAVQTTYMFM